MRTQSKYIEQYGGSTVKVKPELVTQYQVETMQGCLVDVEAVVCLCQAVIDSTRKEELPVKVLSVTAVAQTYWEIQQALEKDRMEKARLQRLSGIEKRARVAA